MPQRRSLLRQVGESCQMCRRHCILGILLLVGAVVVEHPPAPESFWPETARRLRSPGRWLEKKVEEIDFSAQVWNTRHWLPCSNHGQELTASLRLNGKMEQQQPAIIQLSMNQNAAGRH